MQRSQPRGGRITRGRRLPLARGAPAGKVRATPAAGYTPLMRKTTIGSIEMTALVDLQQSYPAGAVYPNVGDFGPYARHLKAGGTVTLNFASFLVRDGATLLLVDTGWGPEHEGKLLFELAEAGVKPGEVTHVLFTHLHGDHTGWNIDRQSGRPIFSRARHFVPKADWDYYSAQAEEAKNAGKPWMGSFHRDVLPLEAAGLVELLDGEKTISSGLTAIPTPGHTPGHTSVVITSGNERGLVLGDVVITPVDAENPELANSFDWDNGIALRTRRQLVERLINDGSLVGASHLPAPGLGRFVRVDGKQGWQGV